MPSRHTPYRIMHSVKQRNFPCTRDVSRSAYCQADTTDLQILCWAVCRADPRRVRGKGLSPVESLQGGRSAARPATVAAPTAAPARAAAACGLAAAAAPWSRQNAPWRRADGGGAAKVTQHHARVLVTTPASISACSHCVSATNRTAEGRRIWKLHTHLQKLLSVRSKLVGAF